jgi:hypothetical protein
MCQIFKSELIIFDECPMIHRNVIESIDRLLREIMQNEILFGGKKIIFSGDFRQIYPVTSNENDSVSGSFKNSWIFKNLKIFQLTIPMRDGSDSVHSKFVDDVGNGVLNNLKQNCEISIDHITKIHSLNKVIQFCFPNLENPRENINSAILASTLLRVNEINKVVLQKLNGPLFPLNAKKK